ncbi:MAG: archaeosortase/exosortase family protein [Cyanobacterium sp.]
MSKFLSVLPFLSIKYSHKINQDFLSLSFLSFLITIQLLLYWRYISNFNSFLIDFLFFVALYYQIYSKQIEINAKSNLAEKIIGLSIILLLYFRAKHIFLMEASVFWYFISILVFLGYILTVAGVRGLNQFRFQFFSIVIVVFFEKFFSLLESRSDILSITVISAKFTSFVLWYLGFDSQTEGSLVYVNDGLIDIYLGCTAIPLFTVLLRLILIISLLFPLSVRKILLSVGVAGIISFILSIIRLIIMALVVNDPIPFEYWHGYEGGNIFTSIGVGIFFAIILIQLPNDSLSQIQFPFRKNASHHSRVFFISANVVLIFILFSFVFNPLAGANPIAQYSFPEKIEFPDWNLQKSIVTSTNPVFRDNDPIVSIEQLRSEQRGWNIILSERSYVYGKRESILTVNLRYVVNTFASLEGYYNKNFHDLPIMQDSDPVLINNNDYLQFTYDNNKFLTTCVNVEGKSSITSNQFVSYYQDLYLNFPKLWQWLKGERLIQDRRCLWIEVSMAKDSNLPREDLNNLLFSLMTYWQHNFPPFRT